MLLPRRIFLAWILGGTAGITLSLSQKVQAVKQPQHLKDALILLSGLHPKNNKYQHEPTLVNWKGFSGAKDYISKADCSGFINKLLSHSYGWTPEFFQQWMNTQRPLAENYYNSIINQNRFQQIIKLEQIKAGDIIAIKYPEGEDNTGHVLLVAELVTEKLFSKPLVPKTRQWSIKVIDQSRSGHGKTDTRRQVDGSFHGGLGQGVLRLYSNQAQEIVGYTWSTFANSQYYSCDERHLAIGRLN
ncbi:NlpC/P60 family protein [Nostoc sp. PA-18-2419]|uniref:NlpC/P60 family protein n=1 Tax=Nostoc sp. PA-18-2419 TaxID=2575443 RepID=UPI0011099B38|nr:NlpC/P60 family protein [Nostoc sp. PA-18-2419]